MRRNVLLVCLALLSLLGASSAFAAAETHDGFSLRLSTGLGYTSSSMTIGGETLGIAGAGGMGGFGLGWAVVPNLILHIDVAGVRAINPAVSIKSGGATVSGDSTATVSVTNFGVGASYYIMPANIYVGGAIHASEMALDNGGKHTDTDTGWGFTLNGGKEWWVSDNWGLGLAAQILFSSIPPNANGTAQGASNMNTVAAGLLFSATYN